MTPEEEAADKVAKLRRVESAAAAALYSTGVTPEEIRAAVEVGIAETLASPIYKAQQERERAAAAK
jgi:hypothetical protein